MTFTLQEWKRAQAAAKIPTGPKRGTPQPCLDGTCDCNPPHPEMKSQKPSLVPEDLVAALNEYHRLQQANKKVLQRPCVICGKIIDMPRNGGIKKYCGDECRTQGRRERERKRARERLYRVR